MLLQIEVTASTTDGNVVFEVEVPHEFAMSYPLGPDRMSDVLRSRFQRALVVGDLNANRWRS